MLEEINNNSVEYWKKQYLEISKENEELLKYKKAWEELIRWLESEVDPSIFSDYSMWEVKSDKVIKRQVLEIISEISEKHNLGSDKDVES